MIDIKAELANYEYINMQSNYDDVGDDNGELASLLEIFTKAYDRIGKEQYKAVNGIDEIIELLEEEKENKDLLKDLKESGHTKDKENQALVAALVNICDIFDFMNSFLMEKGDESLKEQLRFVGNQLAEKLSFAGITALGIEGVTFDPVCYLPIGTDCNEERAEEEILKVVKKGYTYKGKLLRKAEVIVNRKQSE